jgi:hypothetical protein
MSGREYAVKTEGFVKKQGLACHVHSHMAT